MALFGKKKTAVVKKSESVAAPLGAHINASVIIRPVVTEKAAVMGEKNIYTFEVVPHATKRDVRDAVRKLWNVTPRQIRIVNRAPRVFVRKSRNRVSTLSGMKKAYVYLKKDDRIDLV
jgi:large subunit ribosomal protein L23